MNGELSLKRVAGGFVVVAKSRPLTRARGKDGAMLPCGTSVAESEIQFGGTFTDERAARGYAESLNRKAKAQHR